MFQVTPSEPVQTNTLPADFQEKTVAELQPVRLGLFGGLFHSQLFTHFGKDPIPDADQHKITMTINQPDRSRLLSKIVYRNWHYSQLRTRFCFQFISLSGEIVAVLENKSEEQVSEWEEAGFSVKHEREECFELEEDEYVVAVRAGTDGHG